MCSYTLRVMKTLWSGRSREVQTWTNQNIAQTTKSNTWCGADRWAEGRCALCLPHLPTPVTQPSDDRPREPLPFSAAPDEIKGDEQTETESHTQQILPHSLQQQQKPSDGLEAEQCNHSLITADYSGRALSEVHCSKAPQWWQIEEQTPFLIFNLTWIYP